MPDTPTGAPPATSPLPYPRSYWVVPGRLLAGEYPGNPDPVKAREKISHLLDAGVLTFVDLTVAGELDRLGELFVPYEPVVTALARERGLAVECVRFPIPDMSIPSPEEMTEILDLVDDRLAAGRTVYVHCWGGVGRTGTVVGCWLSRHGIASGRKALDRIQELRRTDPTHHRPSPETEEQREMVRTWQERRAGDGRKRKTQP